MLIVIRDDQDTIPQILLNYINPVAGHFKIVSNIDKNILQDYNQLQVGANNII